MDVSRIRRAVRDERMASFVRLMLRSGELLGESLDYHETLHNVCAAAVETVADMCLIDMVDDDGSLKQRAAAHRNPALTPRLLDAGKYLRSAPGYPPHVVLEVIGSHQPMLLARIDVEAIATSPEHERYMRELEYRSMIVAPLISRRYGILGALTIVQSGDLRPYDEASMLFAMDLARRCATAISKSMLYEQTREVSVRFQRAALPKYLPVVEGYAFDSFYEPASSERLVGGDWYDAFDLADGKVAITIGDVQGHGVGAAVLMSSLRDTLRGGFYGGLELAHILRVGDAVMTAEGDGRFATAMVGLLDPAKRTLTVASAGHPGPLIWRSDVEGIIDPFLLRSLPLGLQQRLGLPQAQAETIALDPGTFGCFFTDGLIEWAHDPIQTTNELYRVLSDPAIYAAERPAETIRDTIVRGPTLDDVAILTLRVL